MAWANLINIIVTALAPVPRFLKECPVDAFIQGLGKVVSFGTGAILGNCIGAIKYGDSGFVSRKTERSLRCGNRQPSDINHQYLYPGRRTNGELCRTSFLAKKHHAGEPLREPMEKAIAYLTGIAWPIIILTGVFAEPVIVFLYGNKWLECVPVLRIICAIAAMTIPF